MASGVIQSSIPSGLFEKDSSDFPFEKGHVLTTGSFFDIAGPNDTSAISYSTFNAGHPIFADLANVEFHFDASVLICDFISCDSIFQQEYIFASDEYPEFINNMATGLVGIFISGPNPNGGFYNNKLLTVVPGTQNPVSVTTINDSVNSAYFIYNGDGASPGNEAVQYDGYTVPLQIFPNPNQGTFFLSGELTSTDELSISIVNSLGQFHSMPEGFLLFLLRAELLFPL